LRYPIHFFFLIGIKNFINHFLLPTTQSLCKVFGLIRGHAIWRGNGLSGRETNN
jgi:hypothetical protein